jgi:hypothetical protein
MRELEHVQIVEPNREKTSTLRIPKRTCLNLSLPLSLSLSLSLSLMERNTERFQTAVGVVAVTNIENY